MRIAVVVNGSARRGSEDVATAARRELPLARVLLSRSLGELDVFADELVGDPPDLVVSAGGDGTSIALFNALRRAEARRRPSADRTHGASAELIPEARPRASRHRLGVPVALLKLGTGNAWARATHAPSHKVALGLLRQALSRRDLLTGRASPIVSFDMVEAEGQIAHFTGTGWDAEIIDDFHAQKTGPGFLPEGRRKGLLGYLHGLLTRTVPRNLRLDQAEVRITNTGAEALGVDERGQPFRMPGARAGHVLYTGGSSVCGIGTEPQWGFGFHAFPSAGLVEGRFNLRNYSAKALEGLLNTPKLWAGKHPMPKMDSWLLTRARVDFSRQVAFQIGGDLLGHRDSMEYSIAHEYVELVDWKRLAQALETPEASRPARSVPREQVAGRSLRSTG